MGCQVLQSQSFLEYVEPRLISRVWVQARLPTQKYFNDLDKHRLAFETIKPDDRALIDMAFSKKKADERKEWLRQFRVS
jgi:hypothetical protein